MIQRLKRKLNDGTERMFVENEDGTFELGFFPVQNAPTYETLDEAVEAANSYYDALREVEGTAPLARGAYQGYCERYGVPARSDESLVEDAYTLRFVKPSYPTPIPTMRAFILASRRVQALLSDGEIIDREDAKHRFPKRGKPPVRTCSKCGVETRHLMSASLASNVCEYCYEEYTG